MRVRIKNLAVSSFLGGVGVLLLVLLLQATVGYVLANQQSDGIAVIENKVSAQDGPFFITVLQDEFDGTFESTSVLSREITTSGNYQWGRVSGSASTFTDTFWCVAGGIGPSLDPDQDLYTNNLTTTLTYGPMNLDAVTATLSFRYWISVAAGDGLAWGYATDGVHFSFSAVPTDTMGSWRTLQVPLDAVVGQDEVYLAFRFHSDSAGVDRGAFLDDVLVRATEYVTPSFTASTPVCLDHSVHFSDTSTATSGIQRVEWDFGDGITSTDRVTDHVYTQAGTYTVWLTASSSLGVQRAVSSTVSIECAVADIAISPDLGSTVCQYAPTTYSDIGVVTGTVQSRYWQFSDGHTDVSTSVVHAFDILGPQSASLWVTTTAGCTDTHSVHFNVVAPPQPALAVSPDPTAAGITTYFTDTNNSGVSWTWNFGDGTVVTTNEPNVTHVYQSGGTKTVVLTVTASSGCVGVTQETLPVTAKLYMPLVTQDYFVGWEIWDHFTDWGSGWQHGYVRRLNPNGTVSEEYGFGYKVDKENTVRTSPDGNVYYIWVRDDGDHVFLTGPEKLALYRNFVFEASLRRVTDVRFDGEEYGILISTDPIDGTDQESERLYTLLARLYAGDAHKRKWLVKKWHLDSNHSRTADSLASGEADFYVNNRRTGWNRFKIERDGKYLKFYITSESKWGEFLHVYTYDLSKDFGTDIPEKFYIGFYAARVKDYAYPMEYQFDDVFIKTYNFD